MSSTAPETTMIEQTNDDNSNAHLITKDDWAKAYVMGEEVQALCGKMWVPHKDPERLPMCPLCAETFQQLFGQPYQPR